MCKGALEQCGPRSTHARVSVSWALLSHTAFKNVPTEDTTIVESVATVETTDSGSRGVEEGIARAALAPFPLLLEQTSILRAAGSRALPLLLSLVEKTCELHSRV